MICIYHSRDLDGYCSGAIVKKKYPNAFMVGYDYGQKFPFELIEDGEPIIMVDVSLPMEDMRKVASLSSDFTWIDHHASAINDFHSHKAECDFMAQSFPIKAILKDGISACEGTWNYLFTPDTMPPSVELLGKYDTWRNENIIEWEEAILPFQFGMRLNVNYADNFPMTLLEIYSPSLNDDIQDIITSGKIILQYQKQQNLLACKGAFEISFLGYKAICVNGGGFNSQAFDSVYNPEIHDIMMPFKFNGKRWTFSLYTTKDTVDCSELAKRMGGGGHKKAAGFQATGIPEFLFPKNDLN